METLAIRPKVDKALQAWREDPRRAQGFGIAVQSVDERCAGPGSAIYGPRVDRASLTDGDGIKSLIRRATARAFCNA
jgi:hypothetical protein